MFHYMISKWGGGDSNQQYPLVVSNKDMFEEVSNSPIDINEELFLDLDFLGD